MTDQPSSNSYVDDYQPPQPITPPTPVDVQSTENSAGAIKDQNIFTLLGVEDSSDEEKEAFLDELQQVIWEDFIETDVKMLITEDEMTKLHQLMEKGDSQEVQEEMIDYLEKLIPDLEEIMLEKALELKEDMVRERMAGMREYYSDKPESLQQINVAEKLADQDKWDEAAQTLNSIKR